MRNPMNRLIAIWTLTCCAAAVLPAQERNSDVRHSFSVRGGYAFASGDWTDHPYAPVPLFKQDMAFGGDIAIRLSDDIAVALTGTYSPLRTGDWDAYALSMGDTVRSNASLGYVALVFRPFLKNSAPDLVSLDIGPLLMFASGSEAVGGRSFSYDFMGSTRPGLLAAIEYDRYLGEVFAVYVRAEGVFVFSAMEHSSGGSTSLMTFPVTLGARVLFP